MSGGLFPDIAGHWFAVSDADPRAVALYSRHYSVKNKRPQWACGIGGPGERRVLITAGNRAHAEASAPAPHVVARRPVALPVGLVEDREYRAFWGIDAAPAPSAGRRGGSAKRKTKPA